MRFDVSQDSVLLGLGFQRLALQRLRHRKQSGSLLGGYGIFCPL
jgi:hypothetical protein